MDVGTHTFESEHRIITLLGEIFCQCLDPSRRGFDPDHQYFLLAFVDFLFWYLIFFISWHIYCN